MTDDCSARALSCSRRLGMVATRNMMMKGLSRSRTCMKQRFITLTLLLSHAFCPLGGGAQTLPAPSNTANQNLAPQNLQGGLPAQLPGFSVPATVTTRQTTLGLSPPTGGLSPSSTTTTSSVSVGKGLPGMPGGPRLGAVGGAIDQSSDYMTPPVIGPLFCDPALNIPC